MKSIMRLSTAGSVLALAGALAFSGQAAADEVEATFNGVANQLNFGYSVVLPPGSGGTAKTGTGGAGLYTFTDATGPIEMFGTSNDMFVSFCIDLQDTISQAPSANPYTWSVVTLASAPDASAGPMGAKKAYDLSRLLGAAIASGNLNDAQNLSANQQRALQLAVWEVVHETPGSTYNVSSGQATFTGNATVLGMANDYLAAISTTNLRMAGLVGLTGGQQDFFGQVPIPAAAWLFGSALLGVAALGRRHRKESAESETLA